MTEREEALRLWKQVGGPDVNLIATEGHEADAEQVIEDFYRLARQNAPQGDDYRRGYDECAKRYQQMEAQYRALCESVAEFKGMQLPPTIIAASPPPKVERVDVMRNAPRFERLLKIADILESLVEMSPANTGPDPFPEEPLTQRDHDIGLAAHELRQIAKADAAIQPSTPRGE